MKYIFSLLATIVLSGCSAAPPDNSAGHDEQVLRMFFHFGKFDELDTFSGTYQKDLIPGLVTTTMWLTQREQEIILTKVERVGFFSLPDTLRREDNVMVFPDLGPQVLRINYQDQDKTVVWYEPISSRNKGKSAIDSLKRLLMDIIFSKPEYKSLPPAKGGYL